MAYPSIDIGANPLDSLSPTFTRSIPAPSGMFGGGSKLQNALLAAVAGFMARRNPSVSNNLINGLQSSMNLKQKVALAQQQRAQQLQDQIALHQAERNIDIANPLPTQDDEYTRALKASGIQPGTPEYAQHMGQRASILENPPRYQYVEGIGLVQVGGPQSAPAGPPTAPVGKLRPLGAGGPTPSASGGFL